MRHFFLFLPLIKKVPYPANNLEEDTNLFLIYEVIAYKEEMKPHV